MDWFLYDRKVRLLRVIINYVQSTPSIQKYEACMLTHFTPVFHFYTP